MERNAERGERVAAKWGFGMAPVKPETAVARQAAVDSVVRLLRDGVRSSSLPEDLSTVKGLYTRTFKQDQWDWFTVWRQLSRPGRQQSQRASRLLHEARVALQTGTPADASVEGLTRAGVDVQLRRYPGGGPLVGEAGYVYVLSAREMPQLLKIGYTEREVEERVNEINRDTDVAIPFGVRALWVVNDARSVEAAIHQRLAGHRAGQDRELFSLDFRVAFGIIRDVVYETRREA